MQCPLLQQIKGNTQNRNPKLIKTSSQTVGQWGKASSVLYSHKSLLVTFYAGLWPSRTLSNFLLHTTWLILTAIFSLYLFVCVFLLR